MEAHALICPFATVAGAASMLPVPRGLLVRDRGARPYAWFALLALVAGWTVYFPTGRDPQLRIGLEVASALAIVAGAWRWTWWTRRQGGPDAARQELREAYHRTRESFRDPWILVTGVWLLAMIVMEWRGKTHFATAEYLAITTAFVALIVMHRLGRPRLARFTALDSFAAGPTESARPLGLGCAPPERAPLSAAEPVATPTTPARATAATASER